jgi:inorganic pyrophosphatase
MDTTSYNEIKKFLEQRVEVKIDRPLGSAHPKHGYIYPLNYGYIEGIKAPDGDELDAYILGIFTPLTTFTGICIAIIHRLDDEDDKLIIVPEGKEYSNEQIIALTEFQESFFKSVIIRPEKN